MLLHYQSIDDPYLSILVADGNPGTMCGRYSMALGNEELYDGLEARLPQLFEQGRPRWERPQDHRGRYNVAPRQRAAVVRRDPENGSQAMIEEMQWGLIPHWTKHPPSGALNTINARSEGLLDASSGGMWHALKGYKRCIVPAQGYYEWHKRPSSKVAHFTRLPLSEKQDNAHPPLLFFAGLYDIVKYVSPVESRFQPSDENDFEPYPTGNPLPLATFTILTTTPSRDIEWLHDRMPCILDTWEDVARWLDLGEMKGWEEGKGGTGELLRGRPGLDCFAVPPEVGKIGKDSPTFIQPVSERSDGIKSFFNKQSPAKPKPTPEAKPRAVKEDSEAKSGAVKDEPGLSTKGEQANPRAVKEEQEAKPISRSMKDEQLGEAGPSRPTQKSRRSDSSAKIEAEAEGIKAELPDHDEEQGLGDDSNAPNPTNADAAATEEKEDTSTTATKRKREEKGGAGHRTKVVRKDPADGAGKAQPAITSFFTSPQTKAKTKEPEVTPRRSKRK